ncbi:serine/threonine-protein kinase pim-2-like [Astatotilapia calliptera]|uniref:serine/threonine-protein kinase pim-2-like n=1 Tax=Astatotilapia calliptera TaxID=8154 RepID=UPI000E3FD685|nr:serine/threonine-protein kinase pim-2-like [Astatotilapia calliptera]
MSFKSWPTVTAPRAVSGGNNLEGHTEPWFFRTEDRKPDGQFISSTRKDCAEDKSAFTKKSGKHKSSHNETEEPLNEKSKTSSSREESSRSIYKTDVPLPSTYNSHRLEDFGSKYEELDLLGGGGYGTVYFGKHKEDNVRVVIKHVFQNRVDRLPMLLNGKMTKVPVEVALLMKVGAGPQNTSSNVTPVLLEWLDSVNELIMVFERQKKTIDLDVYLQCRNRFLHESEVKNIMRKLVDAAIEMHSRGVFHWDIKANNIVIDVSADLSMYRQVKYIDFGCGATFTPEAVTRRSEITLDLYESNANTADCITVLQLGTVMDKLLHYILPDTSTKSKSRTRSDISDDCKDFLSGSLNQIHKDHLTLEELKNHPWPN